MEREEKQVKKKKVVLTFLLFLIELSLYLYYLAGYYQGRQMRIGKLNSSKLKHREV